MKTYTVKNERKLFEDHLVVEQAEIHNGGEPFTRTRVRRTPGAAVLVYNKDEDSLVLTRQFRYPIHSETREVILEIMAGMADEGEDPGDSAVREAEEEIGYRIQRKNLRSIAACFVSPGYTSEKLHLYYAEVNNRDRVKAGGGLDEENEDIEIVHLSRSEFEQKVRKSEFEDLKTLISGYWFLLNIKKS